MDKFKKEISRLRSEVRNLKDTSKFVSPFTGIVSGNYWTQTGMPWISSEGRKAVLTEWFWQPIRGQPRRVDTNELRQFSQTFWVTSCIKTLMDEIGSLEWDIIPKEDEEYDAVEPDIKEVKEFLKAPNRNKEPFSFLVKALLKDILELDAGVWVKVYGLESYDFEHLEPKSGAPLLKPMGQRKLMEIYARDGASFLKETDKFGAVHGYWQYSYQIPAHPMWFNREEIVYVSEHPRSMSTYGFARTQAILDLVKSLHYSTLYNKRFFEETAIPDGALALLDTSEAEMNRFMSWWNGEFKAQPHKFAVINKDIKWQPFSVSNRELEFLETQKQYYQFVIAMFGLTPSELGITEDLNRSTSSTQAEVTKRKGIRPFLKLIEDAMNIEILPEFGKEGIEFTFIYDDPVEKAARLANYRTELEIGIRTPNEVRTELGLDPIAGGDIPRGQMMMGQPMGMEGQMGKEGRNVEGETGESKFSTEQGKKEETEPKEKPKKEEKEKSFQKKLKTMSYEELIAEHTRLVSILSSNDPNQLDELLLEQKAELEQYIKENMSKGYVQPAGQYYNEQPIAFPKQNYDPVMFGMYPEGTFIPSQMKPAQQSEQQMAEIMNAIKCPYCGMATLAESNSADDIGSEPTFRCTNCSSVMGKQELIDNAVLAMTMQTMMQNNQTTSESEIVKPMTPMTPKSFDKDYDDIVTKDYVGFDYTKYANIAEFIYSKDYIDFLRSFLGKQAEKVAETLKEGMETNLTITQIAKKLNHFLKDEDRSRLIARTEVIRLANHQALDSYKQAGVTYVKWLSAPEDGRLCNACQKLNGKVLPISSKSLKLDNFPPHPNCRCSFTPVVEL